MYVKVLSCSVACEHFVLQPPKQKPKAGPQKNTKQQPKKSAKPAGSGKAKKKVKIVSKLKKQH